MLYTRPPRGKFLLVTQLRTLKAIKSSFIKDFHKYLNNYNTYQRSIALLYTLWWAAASYSPPPEPSSIIYLTLLWIFLSLKHLFVFIDHFIS